MADATTSITYDAFWLAYLRAHSKRLTRIIHYTGISVIHLGIIAAIAVPDWLLAVGGIVLGYVIAWSAHFTVQGNRPVMFAGVRSALWSLASGLRMYYLGIAGRLKPELERAGVDPEA